MAPKAHTGTLLPPSCGASPRSFPPVPVQLLQAASPPERRAHTRLLPDTPSARPSSEHHRAVQAGPRRLRQKRGLHGSPLPAMPGRAAPGHTLSPQPAGPAPTPRSAGPRQPRSPPLAATAISSRELCGRDRPRARAPAVGLRAGRAVCARVSRLRGSLTRGEGGGGECPDGAARLHPPPRGAAPALRRERNGGAGGTAVGHLKSCLGCLVG